MVKPLKILSFIAAPIVLFALLSLVFFQQGIFLNTTHSLPHFLYRKVESRAFSKGDLIVFCAPEKMDFLPQSYSKTCTYKQPLLKQILGTEGDLVEVTPQGVFINSLLLENSVPVEEFSTWQPPSPLRLKEGEFWVGSTFNSQSFDSRYLGTIQTNAIISKVRVLW